MSSYGLIDKIELVVSHILDQSQDQVFQLNIVQGARPFSIEHRKSVYATSSLGVSKAIYYPSDMIKKFIVHRRNKIVTYNNPYPHNKEKAWKFAMDWLDDNFPLLRLSSGKVVSNKSHEQPTVKASVPSPTFWDLGRPHPEAEKLGTRLQHYFNATCIFTGSELDKQLKELYHKKRKDSYH